MEQKFYICKHCGNIIAKVKDTGVPVICCGEPMSESVPGTTDASVEKHHEERYRALLHNVEMAEVFAKSEVKVWECRNCGHIVIGEKAPEVCPTCNHPQSYFEIHAENY